MNEHELGQKARDFLFSRLSGVRALEVHEPALEVNEHAWVGQGAGFPSDRGYDLDIKVRERAKGGKEWWLCAEVKSHGHPKKARETVFWLKRQVEKLSTRNSSVACYPVFIAPYISPEAAKVCEEEDVGYLDFSGNCHLEFGGVYIRVEGQPNKYIDKRGLQSLFSPKSARVLRVLLQGPLKIWKVKQIESVAGVSLGLVSGVRKKLIEQEWAISDADGLHITQPGKILDAWADADDWNKRTETQEYSLLESDPESIAEAVQSALEEAHLSWAFTQWFAGWLRVPHTIPPVVSVYVSGFPDEKFMREKLGARRVEAGAGRLRLVNGTDHIGLLGGVQKVRGFPCVSDVQIYLDLVSAGQRGLEQAEELRQLENFAGGWK